MSKKVASLVVLFFLLALVGQQVSASPQGYIVLEGGVNRVEGFVPFIVGVDIQTATNSPYDVVVTVYRTIPQVTDVTIRIGGGEGTWIPWISSGSGNAVWEYGSWHFWNIVFSAEGKVEVGLRAPAPAETRHVTVNAQDGFGASENRGAYISPIGQPSTATPTLTATRTPTATATPTATSVPPTATPTVTTTGVPPTVTPTPTSTSSGSPYFTLEGGVNRVEGFVPFSSGVLTTTTAHPFDLVLTSYMVGGTSLTIGVTVSGEPDWTCTLAYGAGSCAYNAGKHAWTAEMVHNWWADNKVEFVFRIPEPRRSTDIAIRAVEYAHGTSASLSAQVLPGRRWVYLPFTLR